MRKTNKQSHLARPSFARTLISSAVLTTMLSACGGGSTDFDVESDIIEFKGQDNATIFLSDYVIGDPEADYSYEIIDLPQHGTLTFFSGTVIYSPDPGFSGEDEFWFTVTNKQGDERTSHISLQIIDDSVAGKTSEQSKLSLNMRTVYSTPMDEVVPLTAYANHQDVEFQASTEPRFGTIEQEENKFLYSPLEGFIGEDSFEISASDDQGNSISSTITIKVGLTEQKTEDQPKLKIDFTKDSNSSVASLDHGSQLHIRPETDVGSNNLSLEWRQIHGPEATIFQDDKGNALIQSVADKNELLLGLFAIDDLAEELIETKTLTHIDKQTGNPFTLKFGNYDAQLVTNSKSHAFVFIADIGIAFVDINDPNSPEIIAVYHTDHFIEQLAVSGNTLYAAGYGFLDVIDISIKEQPELTKTLEIAHIDPIAMAIHGSDVYVTTREQGFIRVDTVNNTYESIIEPRQSDETRIIFSEEGDKYLRIDENNSEFSSYHLFGEAPERQFTYDASHIEDAAYSNNAIFLLESGTLTVINQYSEILFSKNLYNASTGRLSIHNSYMLITTEEKGAFVFDISDLNDIRSVANFNTNGSLIAADIENKTLTLIDSLSGLKAIRLDDVKDIRWNNGFLQSGMTFSARKHGDYLYIGNERQGIQTLDISDPHNIEWVGSQWAPSFNYRTQLIDEMLITSGREAGINIFDPGLNPDDPDHVMQYQTGDARGVAIYKDTMIVANGIYGVTFFDINAPENIISYETDGDAYAVAVHNDLALVANSKAGISLYDLSVPDFPVHIEDLEISGWAYDIIVRDQKAFVAAGHGGIVVLDLADVENIQEIAQFRPNSDNAVVKNLKLFDNEIYAAAGDAGTFVIDVTNVDELRISGQYDTHGSSRSLDVDMDFIYHISPYNGLTLEDNAKPELLQDYSSELAGTILSYDIQWESLGDLAVDCVVTSGQCEIIELDLEAQTAVIDWLTGDNIGAQSIEFSVGNSRFYRKAFDKLILE